MLSGISTSWTYDAGDRLTDVLHFRAANGGILFRANATYDQAGWRLTQTDYDPARVGGGGAGTPNTLAPIRIGSGSGRPNVLAPARLPGTIATRSG